MRNYRMRGGNANTLPAEYYGGDSGRYSATPPPPGECAYGQVVPQSFGMPIEGANAVGPNLCVYPNGSPLQTGGRRRRSRRTRSRRNSKTRRTARGGSRSRVSRKRVSRKRVSRRRSTKGGRRSRK